MHVVRLMGTSGGIRAYGTASLVTRVGAGGVEDFAHVARVLHADQAFAYLRRMSRPRTANS
jgi:hypothetical protein